jgi:C4-dicarboxylate transporter DctM subunit
VPIEAVALKLFTGIENFEIMAIPFFILAGNFLTHGGVARRMINFATSMVGHWYGGLGAGRRDGLRAVRGGLRLVTGHRDGDRLDHAARHGAQGFPKRFGAGVITTSGALGILIPPSIVMVIYSVTGGTSRSGQHLGPSASCSWPASFPASCWRRCSALTTWYRARKNDYPRMPRASWGERFKAFRKSAWGLLLIVLVLGGIYRGWFTPTEAAAVSAVYAFIIAVFVYKDMGLKQVPRVLLDSQPA